MTTPETTTLTVPKGNLAAIAMRVERLLAVNQIRGSFTVTRGAGKPPYLATFAIPEWFFERVSDTTLAVRVIFRVSGANGGDAPEEKRTNPFVIIEAEFVAAYQLSAGEPFSDADAAAFARINGTMNIHPFWREFVHNAMTRAGMPPLLIPPFNPMKGLGVRQDSASVEHVVTSSGRDET